jgi:hypothetical protein
MTIANMHTWFDILQDQYDTPYFTDDERDSFINDAALSYVLEFTTDSKLEGKELEDSIYSNASLAHIIQTVPVTAVASQLTYALIEAQLTTKMIVPLRIIPAAGTSTRPLKYTRFQDLDEELSNPLADHNETSATNNSGMYTVAAEGISLWPAADYATEAVTLTALRIPAETALGGPELVDMPDFTHRKIVAKALVKTGLVTDSQATALMDGVTAG